MPLKVMLLHIGEKGICIKKSDLAVVASYYICGYTRRIFNTLTIAAPQIQLMLK